MKVAYKNHSTLDQILPGHTRFESVRFMPGAVVEIDPEMLKVFAPEDVAHLKPYEPEAPAPLVGKPAPEPDPETAETSDLFALIAAGTVGGLAPQE